MAKTGEDVVRIFDLLGNLLGIYNIPQLWVPFELHRRRRTVWE